MSALYSLAGTLMQEGKTGVHFPNQKCLGFERAVHIQVNQQNAHCFYL
jgi:hypothetical protein